ncbi:MAG: hypothetical protein ACRCYP_06685 [Alphaproteobacteria bacterium]
MGKRALGTLIRLTRQHLDNQRVALLALSEQIQRLEVHISFLEKKIEDEAKISQNHPDYQQDFDAFRRQAQDRCVQLSTSKADLEQRLGELQEKVIDLFKQKKSYEIAQCTSFKKAEKQLLDAEQKALDEISNRIFSAYTS